MSAVARSRLVGPGIVLVALVTIALLVALTVARGDVVRPDQRALPLPQHAVVRYADDTCRRVEDTTVCDMVLAVGPADGVRLRQPAEQLLTAHLRRAGWSAARGRPTMLESPDGTLRALLRGFKALRRSQPDRAAAIGRAVPKQIEVDDLAVIYLIPGSLE